MYEIDDVQIAGWWTVFNPDNKLVEIRLLGKQTFSGYFKDCHTMVTQLRPLLDHGNAQYYGAMQAYFTLNEINEDLYSREQHDVFVKKPKSTTTDGDIVRRRFVLIDLDPSRAASISSSDEEFEKAHLKAVDVYRYLMNEGFKEPIITRSGNGWHLYLPCDMPNDDTHMELVKRFLQSLSKMFGDDCVDIDEKVFNAARIDKLIGTWAKKGSDTKERPWRMATFVKIPKDLSPNDDALFQKVADLLPKEEPKVAPNRPRPNGYGNVPFDLRTWLNTHGVVYKEEKQGASTRFTLEQCPWIDQHSDRKKWDSALFLAPDGQITFNCQHSHCKGRTWFDVRTFYEPDAYNKPTYVPQTPMRTFVPMKPKYVIKEELPELGKKWLSMSDIEKVDLSSIPRVKTGVVEIDQRLLGLAEGEVTLLSGGNASGKSSWLNTLICNFVEQGVPSALFSGELPKHVLKAWIQMVAAGKAHLKPSTYGDGKYYVPNDIGKRIDDWMQGRFFLFNNEYGNTWDEVLHDMNELLKAGVKVFLLDNLMSLDIDLLEGDKNNKQKGLILQIKDFATDNRVHVLLVAHPRKSMAFLRKADISGTADLTNAVDNVFIAHRVNQDFFKAGAEFYGQAYIQQFQGYGNVIEISKNRMYGVCDVLVGLHYELESRRFKNTEYENIHYGWEREPSQGSMVFDDQANKVANAISANNMQAMDESPRDDGLPFAPPMNDGAPF